MPKLVLNGKSVVDAAKPLTIQVQRQDIKGATPTDDQNCPIARSLLRGFKVVSVSVGAGVVYVETPKQYVRFVMSKEDQEMVRAYDQSGYFRPCTLQLNVPPASKRIGARAGTKPGSNKRTGKARSVRNAPPLRHVRLPH